MTHRRLASIACCSIIGLLVAGPFGASVLAAAPIGVERLRRRGVDRRRLHERRRVLPEALDLLVAAIEAGATPHQAIALLARCGPLPLRPVVEAVIRRTERGVPLADALTAIPEALGPPAVPAVDALALAQRHGAPLRDTLGVVSAEAARQRTARAQASARRLPVLLSFPLVVCVLPAFVLLAIAPAVLAALSSIRSTGW